MNDNPRTRGARGARDAPISQTQQHLKQLFLRNLRNLRFAVLDHRRFLARAEGTAYNADFADATTIPAVPAAVPGFAFLVTSPGPVEERAIHIWPNVVDTAIFMEADLRSLPHLRFALEVAEASNVYRLILSDTIPF